MSKKLKGLVLDFETADKITLASLKDHLDTLKKEVKNHEEKGKWMHEEDLKKFKEQLIPAMKTLINYYGG